MGGALRGVAAEDSGGSAREGAELKAGLGRGGANPSLYVLGVRVLNLSEGQGGYGVG